MSFELLVLLLAGLAVLTAMAVKSFTLIDENEIGLVTKNLGKKLPGDNPIAFEGEAGYQAELLMPGLRFMFWPIFSVEKRPWVQVPAGQIGVIVSQVGAPLPIGAKSGVYKEAFGDYRDVKSFIKEGGQKGIQRPVLSPGTVVPLHPVAFLVLTADKTFGVPISEETRRALKEGRRFGLSPDKFTVTVVQPQPTDKGGVQDIVGIVTTLEGPPLPAGDIASRLNGFADLSEKEKETGMTDALLIEALLGSKNKEHNNYQNYQKFLDAGGTMGLQHDPLMYGAYTLNPFLVSVEFAPMLVVQQGQVAVVKAYVGLPTEDTSGAGFKFGSLVRPGHRGIWQEPLRTGKYALNPRCYQVEKVPTCILTLNWAEANSQAHDLDGQLKTINAKSKEGFEFSIDLQVQIHVPDTMAPKVISMVGTMKNLVNEVLQAAVGNHFRDRLQAMPAVKFIEDRQSVQETANAHISKHLGQYEVETKGVYIQDVILPKDIVSVLTAREIANQRVATFQMQETAESQRIAMEEKKATADKQAELVGSRIGIDVAENKAKARENEARGESAYVSQTGAAKAAEVRATALAYAEGFEKQVAALGQQGTTLVNVARSLAENGIAIMPHVLVAGGQGSALDSLAATLTGKFADATDAAKAAPKAPKTDAPVVQAPTV